MRKTKTVRITSHVLENGIATEVNSKRIALSYPPAVWRSLPKELRKPFADTATYFFTHHLALTGSRELRYAFPSPAARSIFFHGLLYALAATSIEFPEKRVSAQSFIQNLYNSDFRLHFAGIPSPLSTKRQYQVNRKTALLPLSFGKDSLLSLAVLKELGFRVTPLLFLEPTSTYENKNKRFLAKVLEENEDIETTFLPNTYGFLRDQAGLMWGWDMLLTQYTLLLLPYLWATGAELLLWSNEQSTNEVETNKRGYILNPTHEQSISWTLHLNNLLHTFRVNATVASLVEPLHELAILYVLHHRYPKLAALQHSCLNDPDKPDKRWCGRCYECARVYIFLVALGIDPLTVGFSDTMLTLSKRPLFYLFSKKNKKNLNSLFQSYPERILSFTLAYRRGVQAPLISLFAKEILPAIEPHISELASHALTMYPSRTMPKGLFEKVRPIYQAELTKFRRELSAVVQVRGEKF